MSTDSIDIAVHAGALPDVLCEQLAVVGQQGIAGFSDDRPVSASLVRSRLTNALTGAPPVLVLARAGEELVGWCAVRHPEPHEARARLWGPVVDPRVRRSGLGSRLLREVTGLVVWPLVTTDVPVDRPGAAEFFARAEWRVLHEVTVLRSVPVLRDTTTTTNGAGFADLEDYVAAAARRFGGYPAGFAEATLRRWRDDPRFRPEHLLLDPPTGSLLLALAQHSEAGSELLLAEVWAEPAARRPLIQAARTLAAHQGLEVVRAVTRDDPAPFIACGMTVGGRCLIFTPPGDR
ncbi:GNAT family N-acetyltransferase [Streptomyces sp. NPDC058052]|uniref:GNAT family N-acetyltransferase n=1 Tax=Streptomyces sp. NPDC058052 TaxID=3346316 RepID=UPI0036F129DD